MSCRADGSGRGFLAEGIGLDPHTGFECSGLGRGGSVPDRKAKGTWWVNCLFSFLYVVPGTCLTCLAPFLKRIAEALQVSVDYLLFDNLPKGGRPEIKDMQLLEMFSTVEQMQPKDKEAVKTLLQALIVKNQVEGVLKAQTVKL